MLRLPRTITVQLTNTSGRPLKERNLLVAINLLSAGRYYYGNLVGLTDEDGRTTTSGAILERAFYRDRATYPMDYKLELLECDDTIELVLLSEKEIGESRAAIAAYGGVDASAVASYECARNRHFAPAMTRVVADSEHDTPLHVALVTSRLEQA